MLASLPLPVMAPKGPGFKHPGFLFSLKLRATWTQN
jgi:hypothetical protein